MEHIVLGTMNTHPIHILCSWILSKDEIMVEASTSGDGDANRFLVSVNVLFKGQNLFVFKVYKDYPNFESFVNAVEFEEVTDTVEVCLANLPFSSFIEMLDIVSKLSFEKGKDELRNHLVDLITPRERKFVKL